MKCKKRDKENLVGVCDRWQLNTSSRLTKLGVEASHLRGPFALVAVRLSSTFILISRCCNNFTPVFMTLYLDVNNRLLVT